MLNSCCLFSFRDLYACPWTAHTSSIAITTSTVSRESRPKSFEKCAVGATYSAVIKTYAQFDMAGRHTFEASLTWLAQKWLVTRDTRI